MNVKNCRGCGRLFNYIVGPYLCPVCREGLEEKFQQVKEYIRNNPGVNIQQVSEACDVEPSQINLWLRQERLELMEGSPLMLGCETCGALIRSGKYCNKCKSNLAKSFQSMIGDRKPIELPEEMKKNRMRYLTDDK